MLQYILKRLLLIIPTLLMILLINFAVIQAAPGGPVEQAIQKAESANNHMAGTGVTGGGGGEVAPSPQSSDAGKSNYRGSRGLSPDMVEQIKKQYGFDKPAHERFWIMLKGYMQFDFGESFFKGKKVTTLIVEKMHATLLLGFFSTFLVYLIAIPLGVYKAVHNGSGFDRATSVMLAIGHAIPVLVFGVVLLVVFAGGTYFQWFPLQGIRSENFDQLSAMGKVLDSLWHLALPLLASVVGGFAGLAYLTKFTFLEELSKQYVLTAKSKGLSERKVLFGHVFRNAMLIIIAGMPAAIVGIFFAGNFFIEIVFNIDGLGLLGFEAIQQRDYPVIFGTLFIFTLLGLIMQLVSDISYHLIDPRIDFESR